jgi:hypothetical protein
MLAKNLSGSSADLSLNTVMTNYDPDLKKLYGLMASAQDMEKVYTEAGKYYQELLESQGLSKADATNTSNTMVGILKNEAEVSDLLRARVVEQDGNLIGPANKDEGNLANATLIRNQIVDFMKYRGPIDIASNIYALLQDFHSEAKNIEDSENDQKIVDAKEEYFEAEGKLTEAVETLYKLLKGYQDTYVVSYSDMQSGVNDFTLKYPTFHQWIIKKALVQADIDFPGSDLSTNSAEFNRVNNSIISCNTTLKGYLDKTSNAKVSLKNALSCYKVIEVYLNDCKEARGKWQEAINAGPNTTLAGENQAELNWFKDNPGESPAALFVESDHYASLKQRHRAIGDDEQGSCRLSEVLSQLNNMSYTVRNNSNDRGKTLPVKDIKNLNSAISLVDVEYYRNLGLDNFSLEQFENRIKPIGGAGTYFFMPANLDSIKKEHISFEYDTMYIWMKGFFRENEGEAEKNAKKKMKERKEEEEEKAENQENQDTQEGETELGDNYSEFSDYAENMFPAGPARKDETTNVISGFVGLAKTFAASDSLDLTLVGMRDSLYATEYCKGMFSYYTLEREANFREKPSYVTTEFDDTLTLSSLGEFNKRNKANNYAYRMELEYILYGDGNCKANIASAGANIFAVRMMLNTPSAFLNFYQPSFAPKKNNTAAAILKMAQLASAATRLPYQLFQAVFILALAATESGVDVKNLMDGHAVALYKRAPGDWVCSMEEEFEATEWESKINGDANNKEANFEDGKVYLFYSDYLYLFLLMGFISSDTGEAQYLRVGDVIQANMRKTSDGKFEGSFLMSDATVYFKLKNKIKVAPLMIALPIFSNDVPSDINSWEYWTFTEEMTRGYQ